MNSSADAPPVATLGSDKEEFPPLKFSRLDLALPALLLILSLVPAVPYLFRGETLIGAIEPGNSENLNEWMLYRRVIDENAERGFFPAWMPQFNSGTPLIGWSHTSRFAPLGVIYSILPYNVAAVVGTYVHLAIFTLSLYLLARLLSRGPWASLSGALFGLLLFQIGEADHFLPRLLTFSWTPLLFSCYVGIWRYRSPAAFLGAIAALGLQVLGGNMETIGREFLTLFIILAGVAAVRPRDLWERRKALILIAASVGGGVALGLIQFLPVYEFVHFSTRSDPAWFSYETFSSTASGRAVAGYIRVILGAITPAVLVLSITEMRKRPAIKVIFICIACLLLLTANPFGLLRVAYRLPFVGKMMWHHLNFYYASILIALLVAFFIDHVLASARARRYIAIFSSTSLAFAAFLKLEAAWFTVSQNQFPMDRVAAYQDRVAVIYLLLALGGMIVIVTGSRARVVAGWLCVLFIIECYIPSFFILHRERLDFPRFNPAYLEYFSRPRPIGRSMTVAPAHRFGRRSIPYQLGSLPGEQTTDSFMTSSIQWYAEFYMQLLPPAKDGGWQRLNFWQLKNPNYISDQNVHLLNFLNVVYVITEEANLKFASHFFPAYHWQARDCPARGCRRTGLSGLVPGGVAIMAPGSWRQTWLAPAGSSFQFELRREGTETDLTAPAWVQVRARVDQTGNHRLLFARFFINSDEVLQNHLQTIDLSDLHGQTLRVGMDVLPPSPSSGSEVPEIEIFNPAVLNPNAYFKRLDLAGLNVFVNPGALPRAFIVHKYNVVPDAAARLKYLRNRVFQPAKEVLLEAPLNLPVRDSSWPAGEKIEIQSYQADRVMIGADLTDPGLVVLGDVWYPGWRAEVDGVEAPILRANHAFRAVWLDAGRHSVTFSFRPASLRLGLWVSATAGFCAIGSFLIFFFSRVRRAGPGH